MGHLRVRCPSCAKLYEVDDALIFSAAPHFRCVSCPAEFTFDYPAADPGNVQARSLAPAAASAPANSAGVAPAPRSKKPGLERRWKDLLRNYTDESRHQAFVMACREAQALEFAREKYESLRQVQGSDDIADRFLARITGLETVNLDSGPRTASPKTVESFFRRWRRAIIASPFVLSALLIVWGLTHAGQRNMVGTGIAIALLSFGLMAGFRRTKPSM